MSADSNSTAPATTTDNGDPQKLEGKTVKEIMRILTEHGVEIPQTRQVKSFYVDLYKKHILKITTTTSEHSPTASIPPTPSTEPARKSTTTVRTRKDRTPKRVRPLSFDDDEDASAENPNKKMRLGDTQDSADVTMSEPSSDAYSQNLSSEPQQENPPAAAAAAKLVEEAVALVAPTVDTFKVPPSSRLQQQPSPRTVTASPLSVNTEPNQLRNRQTLGTPHPLAAHENQALRQSFGSQKTFLSPEMARSLNVQQTTKQASPVATTTITNQEDDVSITLNPSSPAATANKSLNMDDSIISLHTPKAPAYSQIVPNSPGLSPSAMKQLTPPPSQFCYSFAQQVLSVLIGILVFMAVFLAYTYSNPAKDLPFCDESMRDPAVPCRPCPQFGSCETGELQACKGGYEKRNNLCVQNEQVVSCYTTFLEHIKVHIAELEGTSICQGNKPDSAGLTMTNISHAFDEWQNGNVEADLVKPCLQQVETRLKQDAQALSLKWMPKQTPDQDLITSTNPIFSLACLAQIKWQEYQVPILTALALVALSLIANMYNQYKQEQATHVESLVLMVLEKLKLLGANKLIAVSNIQNEIRQELQMGESQEQVALAKRVDALWPMVEAKIAQKSEVEEAAGSEGVTYWSIKSVHLDSSFLNHLENASEMYPSPAKSPTAIPLQ